LLPADKVYGLSIGTRDSMLIGKTFYPADNDSTSTVAYNYGSSTEVEDYMYVSMSYETSQRGTGMIEIRKFTMENDNNLVVVSQTGGVPGNYHQAGLSAYLFRYNRLAPYRRNIFPAAADSLFMKEGIPDSIRQTIINNSNIVFDFGTKTPTLKLNSPYLTSNATIRSWLKGDHADLAWTGDRFIIRKIGFTE